MISVIIPIFNSTTTIFKCLEALRSQILKPDEIIIVDDGSTDGLEYKITVYKKKFKTCRLVFFKQCHKGAAEARNLGARKAKSEILAFIDSDCIPGRNWLKNIHFVFENPKVGAVGGSYSSGIDNGFWQRFSYEELYFRRKRRGRFVSTLLSNNMACRKDCFWDVGGFPKYSVCEDMLLSYRISRHHLVIWLKSNGVRHHFKNCLKYFFGKESTIFFLKNPAVLKSNNHQGKQLHFSILTSYLTLTVVFLFFISILFNKPLFTRAVLIFTFLFLFLHLLLYIEFILHLKKKKFTSPEIVRAYYISFLRDVVAAFSFFIGVTLYFRKK